MSRRFDDVSRPIKGPPFVSRWLLGIIGAAMIAGGLAVLFPAKAHAESAMALARECADSLARRNHLDHEGFGVKGHIGFCRGRGRCARGSRAENVGYGYKTEAAMIAAWWRSPGHAANMRLGPITVAGAVSSSGRQYWCGVVGE